MRFIAIVLAFLLVSGCTFLVEGENNYKVAVNHLEERIFADCDSFLAYYDSCDRFYESIPGSVCEQRYGITPDVMYSLGEDDVPSSDTDCYALVECNWFRSLSQTASRLAECRVTGPVRPRCIISYDVRCVGFNATQKQVNVRILNNMSTPMNQVELSLVLPGSITIPCRDSKDDRILNSREADTFVCKAKDTMLPLPRTRTLRASMRLVYSDPAANNSLTTRSGVLEVQV